MNNIPYLRKVCAFWKLTSIKSHLIAQRGDCNADRVHAKLETVHVWQGNKTNWLKKLLK